MLQNYTILFFFSILTNSWATIFETLNPTQQKFIEQLNIQDLHNQIYIIAEFRYLPLAYFYNNQTTSRSVENKQLLFGITSESSPKFFIYLQLNIDVKLCMQFETIDIMTQETQIVEEQFIIDIYEIEGNWFSIETRIDLLIGTTNITIYQNEKQSNFFQKLFQNQYLNINQIFYIEVGLTQLVDQLELDHFQGLIKLEQLDWSSDHYPTTIQYTKNFTNQMFQHELFSSESFYIYQLTQNINQCFGLKGWVKVGKVTLNEVIYILTVFANPNALINFRIEILSITYYISDSQGLISLKYSSYTFPIPIFEENERKYSIENIYTDQNFLYDWHFLSILYKDKSVTFQIQYPSEPDRNSIKYIQNVYFFSDTHQTILLGGYYTNEKLYNNAQGDLFYFDYTYQVGINFPQINCNINCQTCFGPYSNQCITCDENTKYRKYNKKSHECFCQIGYVDTGDGYCQHNFGETQINLLPLSETIEYDRKQPIVVCSFGYFKYKDKCYQCPKINKKSPCFQCLQNPDGWVYLPYCLLFQQQIEQNDDYIYEPIGGVVVAAVWADKYNVYIFQDEELIFCQNCANLCLTFPMLNNCQLSSYYHLNQQVYIRCNLNAIFVDGKCEDRFSNKFQVYYQQYNSLNSLKSYRTNDYCTQQIYRGCKSCLENYFLSQNTTQCLFCGINNCKICFQYSMFDQSQTSLLSIETKYYDDDLAIGCALCFAGYQFNFYTGMCESIDLQFPDCKNQYKDQQQNYICFETTSNDFSKGTIINQCQKYMFNCQRCFSPVKNQYYCVECEVGYYFSGEEGICIKCQNYFSDFLTCYSEYLSVHDQQLLDAIGFVFSFQKIYPLNEINRDMFSTVKPTKCVEGKQVFIGNCFQTSADSCYQFDKQCNRCSDDKYGTKRLTFKNLQCINCPYYCEYCLDRIMDTKLLNPYFEPSIQTYKLQCLRNRNIQNLFIDNYFGQVRNCNLFQKCETQFVFISTGYIAFYSHFILQPFEVEFFNIQAVSIIKHVLDCTETMIFDMSFYNITAFENLLVKEVLTLYQTEVLIYNSQQISNIFAFANLQFINIQKLEFNYIQLNFSIFYNSSISLISQTAINLLLHNVMIANSYFKPDNLQLTAPDEKYPGRSYQISINFPNNITLKNIFISNMSFINTYFIFLNSSLQTQLEIYNVTNLTITNCNFISSIFSFINGQIFKNVTFNQVTLENCTFTMSSFLRFSSQLGFIYMSNIVVRDCTFQDAVILAFDQSRTVYLSDIKFFNCIFESSKAISIQSSIVFQQLVVDKCHFQQSQIIYGYSFNDTAIFISFTNFLLRNSIHRNSDIFKIIGAQLIFSIDQLNVSNFTSPKLSQNYIFSLFGDKLEAKTIFLKRNINCQEFFFQNFSNIILTNTFVTSYNPFIFNQQFLYTRGQNITMKDFYIQNQNVLDDKLIFIESASLNSENQILELQNWQIVNCSCIKSQTNYLSSILFLNLLSEFQIIVSNSIFENIWQNQELQDSEISSANIMVVNAPSSQVDFINIKIQNCLIANTSDSNFLIKALSFRLIESKANYINSQFNHFKNFKNFLQFRYGKEFYFRQQSFGGLAYIQTQTLIVQNCSFTNVIGLYGGTFYIVTKYNGNVRFSNLFFLNQSSSNDQYSNGIGGSLFLDSDNSPLKFYLENISVKNSTSNYLTGFLHIKLSSISNQLIIKNLNLNDVYSKESSIFSFANSSYQNSNSMINFANISIRNSLANYLQFKNYYRIPYDQNSTKGLLYVSGSKIKANNLSFEGYAHENVIFFEFYAALVIKRLVIQNTQTNSQSLVKISNLINSVKNYVVLNQIKFFKCTNIGNYTNSMFGIFLQTNHYTIILEEIDFSLNKCRTCRNGLFLIQNSDSYGEQNVILNHLTFHSNQCGNQSCLLLQFQQSNNQLKTKINQGNFISNQAKFGGAINCAFTICQITNCYFLHNKASQGGAVYIINNNKNPFHNNYFIENQAQIGGSLFFANNSSITNDSRLLFFDNKAQIFANNIVEQPIFLQFIIDGVDIFNEGKMLNNEKIDRANISGIYYPSGVKLADYLYFNYTNLHYNKINYQILLKAYNHLYEEINDLDGSYCTISYPNEANSSLYSDEVQKLYYDSIKQAYDFNQIIFISNPDNNEGLLVDLQCTSISEEYSLQFVIKTFKCQIGEYLFENKCLRCDSSAGYYSVDQNTCKRIDIAMIIETTGAMLNLQPQYWRPTLHSDNIEQCKKTPYKCLGGWYPGDSSCIQGGVGGLCEECDLYNIQGFGHFFNSGTGDCKICGQFITQILFLLLSTIWTVILTLMTYESTQKSLQRLAQLKVLYLKFQTLYTFSLDQTSILIKMGNNYFQILMVISTFQITFFHNLKGAFEFFGQTSSVMTYQFDCTLASFLSTPYIYSHYIMILTITVFNHSITTFIFITMIVLKLKKFSSSYIYTSIFYFYTYNQQSILNWGISLASRRTISGEDYIQASVNYKYYTQEHIEWLTRFVLPALFVFGIFIPILIVFVLCKSRKRLYHKTTRKLLSYLINEYSDDAYYWEIVRISLKIVIVVAVNFLEQLIEIKGILIVIFVLLYYKLLIYCKPYRQTQFNQLEQRISFNVIMIILFSLLLYFTEQLNNIFSYVLEFLIVSLILYIIITFIRQLFVAFWRKLNEKLDFIREFILYKFPTLQIQFPFLHKYLQLKRHQSQRVNQCFNKIRANLRNRIMSQRDFRITALQKHRLTATPILLTQVDELSPLK